MESQILKEETESKTPQQVNQRDLAMNQLVGYCFDRCYDTYLQNRKLGFKCAGRYP